MFRPLAGCPLPLFPKRSAEQSCASLVGEELDVEELVVALWKNELGAEVTTLKTDQLHLTGLHMYCTVLRFQTGMQSNVTLDTS